MTTVWRGDDAAVLLVAPAVDGAIQRARGLRELVGHLADSGYGDLVPEALTLRHHCPGCGSVSHGAPFLAWNESKVSHGGVAPDLPRVSFSRSSGWLAVAWSARGRIGVDIDDVGHPAFADGGLDDGIFTLEEQNRHRHASKSRRRIARAQDWVAKEALAKAAGVGFSTQDPSEFTITAEGRLVSCGVLHNGGRLVPSAEWDLPADVKIARLVGAVVLVEDSAQRE